MPDRVDAAVNPVQTSAANTAQHLVPAETCASKLGNRHHTVLLRRDLRHQNVWPVELVAHTATKSTGNAESPRVWAYGDGKRFTAAASPTAPTVIE